MRKTLTNCLVSAVISLVIIVLPTQANDASFLTAKKAASSKQWERFFDIKPTLRDHPLYPYLDYYYIDHHFYTIEDIVIKQYIETYPKSPMANKLRKKWLREFAGKQQWQAFLDWYQPTGNISLQCHYLTALDHTGRGQEAKAAILPLWLTDKTQPDSCQLLFDRWLNASAEKDSLILQRFKLALLGKKFELANQLVKKLSPQQKKEAIAILKVYQNPKLVTKSSFLKSHPVAEVLSYGLSRLARMNPKMGIAQWQKLRKKVSFTLEQEQRIFKSVGLAMALRKNSESVKWFRKVLGADLAPVYKDWMIRSAIIYKDWPLVIESIDALKSDERNTLRWQYWYGRALQQLGKTDQAIVLLSKVGKERNYYGFLANYYLKRPIQVKHKKLTLTQQEIDTVRHYPGFQRALLLYQLNQKHDARVELFTLMHHITEKEQYIVTTLISDWGWHPQSLRLSHYADHKDDIEVRFPMPYKDQVATYTTQYGVDSALVYAIIRQESYFMPQAKSPAGAIGLMQLMPGTASRTAKQFSLAYQGRSDLEDGIKNIKLGSAHLNKLKQQLNAHPALVIAAYNAGRNAVKRWLPEKTIPTDVWVETVTYHETRHYLRSVIAGYVVYQHRLGLAPSLDAIMTQIPFRSKSS